MWQFLIFNGAWFFLVILVHLYGRQWMKTFCVGLLFICLIVATFIFPLDPFSIVFYFLYSWALLKLAASFKQWSMSKTALLDEELGFLKEKSDLENQELESKSAQVGLVEKRFSEMSHLYDKIKEMSQALDFPELFLVFCEALSDDAEFHEIKLFFFNPDGSSFQKPHDTLGLVADDFKGLWDRSIYLNERAKLKKTVLPFEEKICQLVLDRRMAVEIFSTSDDSVDPRLRLWPDFKPFAAYPIELNGKVFAVLSVFGVSRASTALLRVLTQRFASEFERIQLYQSIQTLAMTDGLTGAFVRRYLWDRLEGEVDRSQKFDLKLSFLMIDVDYFKKFNDEYGHPIGDAVLRQVSDTIKKNIRDPDLLGRYGGEEFAVILIETDESDAFLVAERIRQAVASNAFKAYDENLKATVSIGCATMSKKISQPQALIEAADEALYQAKNQAGRGG